MPLEPGNEQTRPDRDIQETTRDTGLSAVLSATLLASAIALAAAAFLVFLTGGVQFRLGGLNMSARDPARLFLEASLSLLVRELLRRRSATTSWRAIALTAFFLATLVWESSPRLIGDGSEYVAMTRQLSLGRPPGVSPSDVEETDRYFAAFTGSRFAPPAGSVEDRSGRWQFVHFWGYSLLAAPFALIADLVGVHPNAAFTVLNVLLLCGAVAVAAPRIGLAATSLLLLGPSIWWVDKAHTELLTLASLTAAGALLPTRPSVALPLIGLAAAQNPPLAIVLVAAILWVRLRQGRLPWITCGVSVGLAALHPLYYWWTIGRLSPLAGAIVPHVPGATAYLTPLLDPDLGLAWAFAGLTAGILLVIPAVLRPACIKRFWIEGALVMACGLTLLLAFAQTGNVNHGGTPGPSRYTMWLVPLAFPIFHAPSILIATWRRHVLSAIAIASLLTSAVFYHPKLPQDISRHTPLATWLLASWPQLYNPLPEVFVERTPVTDGELMLPVATPHCEKVLLGGETNGSVLWPIPCGPAPVPEMCRAAGTLCYGNQTNAGYAFVLAPVQPGLPSPAQAPAWNDTDRPAWNVLGLDWSAVRRVSPQSETSFVRGTQDIVRIAALQTDRDMVAWVRTAGAGNPSVMLRLPARAAWWLLDGGAPPSSLPAPGGTIEPGERVSLPAGSSVILLVRVTPVV